MHKSPSSQPPSMPSRFDPYHRWLGIPPGKIPPSHYRLLGLVEFEDDADVIQEASDRQMGHVKRHAGGPHSAESQQLLNELASATLTLLDPVKKLRYDESLRLSSSAFAESAAEKSASQTPAEPPPIQPSPAAISISTPRVVRPPAPPTRIAAPLPASSPHKPPPTLMTDPSSPWPPNIVGQGVLSTPSATSQTRWPTALTRIAGAWQRWNSNHLFRFVFTAVIACLITIIGLAVIMTVLDSGIETSNRPHIGIAPREDGAEQPESGDNQPGGAPPLVVVPMSPREVANLQRAWAQHHDLEPLRTTPMGMRLVLIPPGKFSMGTAIGGKDNETPPHEVTLSRVYYLGDREVTVRQFQQFIDDAAYSSAEKPEQWRGVDAVQPHTRLPREFG